MQAAKTFAACKDRVAHANRRAKGEGLGGNDLQPLNGGFWGLLAGYKKKEKPQPQGGFFLAVNG